MTIVCAALVGCGGGESQPAPAPAQETQSGGGAQEAPDAAVKQAVDNCTKSIERQPTLSSDVKSELMEICEKAAKGDENDVREASQEVCEKLIEENVPAGPAREQAKSSCAQANQGG